MFAFLFHFLPMVLCYFFCSFFVTFAVSTHVFIMFVFVAFCRFYVNFLIWVGKKKFTSANCIASLRHVAIVFLLLCSWLFIYLFAGGKPSSRNGFCFLFVILSCLWCCELVVMLMVVFMAFSKKRFLRSYFCCGNVFLSLFSPLSLCIFIDLWILISFSVFVSIFILVFFTLFYFTIVDCMQSWRSVVQRFTDRIM